MSVHEASLSAIAETPEKLVKLVEVLSRTLTGLGLDGFETKLVVCDLTCTCGDHDDDDDVDTTI